MVIFDKTGTLTEGQVGVVGIVTVDVVSENQALEVAAAVESDSELMIAQALLRAAEERGLELPFVSGFEALKGRWVKGSVAGSTVYVGGPRLLEMMEVELP